MMLKFSIFSFCMYMLSLFPSSGWDAGYSCYVRNKTSEVVYLRTKPAIENFSDESSKNSPLSKPIYSEDSTATYKLNPGDVVRLQSSAESKPDVKSFPYTYLEVIYNSQKDTLRFTDKKAIVNAFKQESNTKRYYLVVQ